MAQVEFLNFLEIKQIPIVIISGGLQGMVESVLKPYLHRIEAIHAILQGRRFANDINTSGNYLQVNSRYESGTEMVAKADIMASYHADD